MRIAIVGCSGYIGSKLFIGFQRSGMADEIVKIGITESDNVVHLNLLEPEKFNYDLLQGLDYILFLSAVSSPDVCQKDYDKSWKINVIGTEYFIRKAIKQGCKILFFSSDAVYGKDKGNVFYEKTETNADTDYGIMKKKIEDLFRDNISFKAVRLSYVVSREDRFLSYCLSCMENNCEAVIYHPFYRNCVVMHDVLEAVTWMLLYWNDYPDWVLNVCGNEQISRVEIADSLNRLYDGRLKYRIEFPSQDFFACRHEVIQMNSMYLYQMKILCNMPFIEKLRLELGKG